MEIVRAGALATRSSADDGVAATWLAGPDQGETLDVAIVHFTAGAATPPHVHHGGQTLVAVAGTGYVEVGGERAILHPGHAAWRGSLRRTCVAARHGQPRD